MWSGDPDFNFTQSHILTIDTVSKIWARWDLGARRYAPDNITFFYDLNLIPRAMVQGHCTPFPKTENGQIWPRGEKISIQVILDGQTDGMTDGLITIERPQSGALIRNLQYWSFDILITRYHTNKRPASFIASIFWCFF